MVRLIGSKGCSRCEMVKNILNSRGIDYDYILFEDLSEEDKKRIRKEAVEKGLMSMPIIQKDGVIVSIKDLM